MKEIKCDKCGDPIINRPSYMNKKRVCQKCFRKLKYSKRVSPLKKYLEWLK